MNRIEAKKPTNYERIKGMNLEEMAAYLADVFDCSEKIAAYLANGFDCSICSEYKRLTSAKYDSCDNQCAKHCVEWLENI